MKAPVHLQVLQLVGPVLAALLAVMLLSLAGCSGMELGPRTAGWVIGALLMYVVIVLLCFGWFYGRGGRRGGRT